MLLMLLAVVAFALVLPLTETPRALAQDGPGVEEAAEGPAAAATDDDDNSLFDLIVGTGPTGWLFMGILLLFSFYCVTVAIERAMATRRNKVLPGEFLGEVKSLSENPHVQIGLFEDPCSRWDVPVARVLEAGALRCQRPVVSKESR